MSDPILSTFNPIAYIRTYVPVAVGSILGWLLATFTWLADALQAIASYMPPDVDIRGLLNAIAIAGVIALYYWIARKIGKRYPQIEKWLLGSAATPVYQVQPKK